MRDNHYRNRCINGDYDKVVDFIKHRYIQNTPLAAGCGLDHAEEFASNVVNECIKAVLYPKTYTHTNGVPGKIQLSYAEKEMCIAVKSCNTGYEKEKVILAIRL